MLTRSQRHAAKAFEQVNGLGQAQKDQRDRYGSMALRLPALIRTAGLSQALAFVASKEKPGDQLLCHLATLLGEPDSSSLLWRSRNATLPDYMHLTSEVLEASIWYGRFARSILGVEPGEEPDEGERE
jgi:CRISPR-associated protein Cmr5